MTVVPKWVHILLIGGAVIATRSSAETLFQAMDAAVQDNAALAEAEAKLGATVQEVPLARANGRPNAAVNSQLLHRFETRAEGVDTPASIGTAQAKVTVPIFNGGAVKHSIHAAKATVEGERASLIESKMELLINVATVYVQLIAARQQLEIKRSYVSELENILASTNIRFSAGELTKTDINQVKTALSSARVSYLNDMASVRALERQYIYYVGHPAGELGPPPALPLMPENEEQAVEFAVRHNPGVLAAQSDANAAIENKRAAEGARFPRVQLTGSDNYINDLNTARNIFGRLNNQAHHYAEFGIAMTIPLYQGGATLAKIRQARSQELEAQDNARDVADNIRSSVGSQFAQFSALTDQGQVAQDQALTAADAFAGVKMLNQLGDRTSQDVLYAEQAVLSAKSQSIQIAANRYIAAVTLLGRMGSLVGLNAEGWLICEDDARRSSKGACSPNF